MAGKPFGDQLPEHRLDREVDLGDEIGHTLFVDTEAGAQMGHLGFTRLGDGLDGRRQEQWIVGHTPLSGDTLGHSDFHAPLVGPFD